MGSTGVAEDAAFSPDGKEIAVAFGDRIGADLQHASDGRLLAPLAGHTDAVTSVGYDPAGQTIVTGATTAPRGSGARTRGDQLRSIDRQRGTRRRAHSPVATRARRRGRRDARPHDRRPLVRDAFRPRSADRRGRGRRRLARARRRRRRPRSSRPPRHRDDGAAPRGQPPSRSRRTGTLVTGLERRNGPHLAAGRRLAAGRQTPEAGRGDLRGARPLRDDERRDGRCASTRSTAASCGRSRACAASPRLARTERSSRTTHAREAELWDAATGKLLHRLTGHRSLVTDAEFSPTATSARHRQRRPRRAASGTSRRGRLLHVLRGHFFAVRTASFSPDGRWVVTASQFTAGLWDACTGQLVLYLQGHTRPLTGATFSAGRRLDRHRQRRRDGAGRPLRHLPRPGRAPGTRCAEARGNRQLNRLNRLYTAGA